MVAQLISACLVPCCARRSSRTKTANDREEVRCTPISKSRRTSVRSTSTYQVSNYASSGAATTIYVGGLLEKVMTSAGTDFRHMIQAGGSTIIVSRQSSGTNSVYYVTSE